MDKAGSLYGTTSLGGATTCESFSIIPGGGTAFKLDPSGNLTVLHSFTCFPSTDGGYPSAALIMDRAANLYTTFFGGSGSEGCFTLGCGIVFRLDTSGNETVLHRFTFAVTGGAGSNPEAALLMDSAGNLYGITSGGPATNNGTVFKLTLGSAGCATDETSSISVTRSGFVFNFGTQRFYQTLTLTNTGGSAISGPVSLVLDSLSSSASLFNESGTTSCAAPLGSPYINTSSASLAPGASESVTLQFTDPTRAAIAYTSRVLAGSGTR